MPYPWRSPAKIRIFPNLDNSIQNFIEKKDVLTKFAGDFKIIKRKICEWLMVLRCYNIKISRKYPGNIQNIQKNIQEISRKYPKYPKKYPRNIQEISKISKKISRKYPGNIQEIPKISVVFRSGARRFSFCSSFLTFLLIKRWWSQHQHMSKYEIKQCLPK